MRLPHAFHLVTLVAVAASPPLAAQSRNTSNLVNIPIERLTLPNGLEVILPLTPEFRRWWWTCGITLARRMMYQAVPASRTCSST